MNCDVSFRISDVLDDCPRAQEINVELPGWRPAHELDLPLAPDGEFEVVDCVLTSNHPEQDYAGARWTERHRCVLLHMADDRLPCAADHVVVSNQLTPDWAPPFSVGVPYPVIARERIEICRELARTCAERHAAPARGAVFHGWYSPRHHRRERLDAITALRANSHALNAQVVLEDTFRGRTPWVDWIRWCSASAVCVVPPGAGINSWRLSELLAAGAFVIAVAPVDRLLFDPPLRDGEHYIACSPDEIADACAAWLRRPWQERHAIGQNAAAWAEECVLFDGWKRNVRRKIIDRCVDVLRRQASVERL